MHPPNCPAPSIYTHRLTRYEFDIVSLVGLRHPPAGAVEITHRHVTPVTCLVDYVQVGEHLQEGTGWMHGGVLCGDKRDTQLSVNCRWQARYTLQHVQLATQTTHKQTHSLLQHPP